MTGACRHGKPGAASTSQGGDDDEGAAAKDLCCPQCTATLLQIEARSYLHLTRRPGDEINPATRSQFVHLSADAADLWLPTRASRECSDRCVCALLFDNCCQKISPKVELHKCLLCLPTTGCSQRATVHRMQVPRYSRAGPFAVERQSAVAR